MIVSVQGALETKGPDYAVINVGGVGLLVFAPTSTLALLGDIGRGVRLHTHLHFREDVLALYGFATQEELRLFQMLMGVAGVGPKTGLSALSVMSPNDLVSAILADDLNALVRIPGVGKKTAARIVLELKGKLEKEWVVAPGAVAHAAPDADAVAALTALGYSQAEARAALAAVEDVHALPLEEKIRRALQQTGRR